ncbi:TPA: serine/threonine protein kinase [Acinetobacter baumannii]|nr:serine/threonine protein kinase [Acinetobacter baumannii]
MSDYSIIDYLGEGGFAKVYLVQFQNGFTAAKKIFHPNQEQPLSEEYINHIKSRFRREVLILSSISHPNVVSVLRSEVDLEPPSYLMPVADSTLEKDMDFLRTQPLPNRIKVMMDILAGLETIHNLSIYHRDLKPSNILRFGENYAISDFGLVSLDKSQISVLTQTGMRMGSDKYTAPEITNELKYASRASDIYSAGCIFHDLTTTLSVGSRVTCNEIRDPTNPYEPILKICTRFDKNRRFQSVESLREAIISTIVNQAATLPTSNSDSQVLLQQLQVGSAYDSNLLSQLVDFLERATETEAYPVLINLDQDIIHKIIASNDSNFISRISTVYSNWLMKSSFDFSLCDVLASRVDLFWAVNDPEVKSNVLLGLLIMGTNHNRWYVEEKFVNRIKTCDEFTARRFVLESAVHKLQVIPAINHLPRSINFSRSSLPAIIQQGFTTHGI